MRKIYIALGNAVQDYLKDIEYGYTKRNSKRLNPKLIVERVNDDSCPSKHPITVVHNISNYVQVRYFETNIVTVGCDDKGRYYCYINNGGYSTITTKNYINAVLDALRLSYYIRIKNRKMQLICTKYNNECQVSDFNGSYFIYE